MKTTKKKSRNPEKMEDDFVRKPVKKHTEGKRDRRISIYNPTDEDEDALESFDDLLDLDLDSYEDEDDY